MECFLPRIGVLLCQLHIFLYTSFSCGSKGNSHHYGKSKMSQLNYWRESWWGEKIVIVKAWIRKGFINCVPSTRGPKGTTETKAARREDGWILLLLRNLSSSGSLPLPGQPHSPAPVLFSSLWTGTTAHSNALQTEMERHLFSKKRQRERKEKMKVQERHSNFLTLIFFLPSRGLGSEGLNLSQL